MKEIKTSLHPMLKSLIVKKHKENKVFNNIFQHSTTGQMFKISIPSKTPGKTVAKNNVFWHVARNILFAPFLLIYIRENQDILVIDLIW